MWMRLFAIMSIILLIDIYFFQAVKTLTRDLFERKKRIIYYAYWIFTFLTVLYLFLSSAIIPGGLPNTIANFIKGVLITFMVSKLLGCAVLFMEDVSRLVRWINQRLIFRRERKKDSTTPKPTNAISRGRFLSQVAIVTGALPVAPMIYGVVRGAYHYNIRNIPLALPNLPNSFNGLKIAQISDLHLGSFASLEPVKQITELVMEQEADVIFFTGDLVNFRTDEVYPYADILSELNAPEGVYSILGNHDYGDYYLTWENEEAKERNFDDLLKIQEEMGWDLLLNENRILEKNGDNLAIVGVENWGTASRFHKLGDVGKAKKGAEHVPVKLLLSHDPSHWDAKVLGNHPDMDVMFSGHTHGAQFGVETQNFKWSPVQYAYKQWAGLYQSAHQQLYVNRGAGFIGYPGRVGIRPEITVFELKKG